MDDFIIANRTDVGIARQVNEDSMVTFDSPNGRVVAVCDGMGGQAAGDVASRLACDIITDILTSNTFSSPTEAITRACLAANQGILHRASQDPNLEGMGSTCVMVIIKDGLVYYGWIGDSRIYYINNGVVQQLSRDQSYVQQLVDSGQLTLQEAENHPNKNEITNALGLPTMTPPELCTSPLAPAKGSVVLLCSDGLSGMVDNHTIGQIISEPDLNLNARVYKLVDKANANGGQDNITVQAIEFGKPEKKKAKGAAAGGGFFGNKYTLWGAIAAAVIILVFVLIAFLSGGKKEETKPAATPAVPARVEDNRDTESKNLQPTVKTKEVVHESSHKKSTTTKSKTKSGKDAANKVGAKTKSKQTETSNTNQSKPEEHGNKKVQDAIESQK